MRVTLSPDAQKLTFDTDSFLFENLVFILLNTGNRELTIPAPTKPPGPAPRAPPARRGTAPRTHARAPCEVILVWMMSAVEASSVHSMSTRSSPESGSRDALATSGADRASGDPRKMTPWAHGVGAPHGPVESVPPSGSP